MQCIHHVLLFMGKAWLWWITFLRWLVPAAAAQHGTWNIALRGYSGGLDQWTRGPSKAGDNHRRNTQAQWTSPQTIVKKGSSTGKEHVCKAGSRDGPFIIRRSSRRAQVVSTKRPDLLSRCWFIPRGTQQVQYSFWKMDLPGALMGKIQW